MKSLLHLLASALAVLITAYIVPSVYVSGFFVALVVAVVLGILSVLLSSPPISGIILGVLSLIFATKQQKNFRNGWSKAGRILAIVGIVLSILSWIAIAWLQKNPDLYNQLLQGAAQ